MRQTKKKREKWPKKKIKNNGSMVSNCPSKEKKKGCIGEKSLLRKEKSEKKRNFYTKEKRSQESILRQEIMTSDLTLGEFISFN